MMKKERLQKLLRKIQELVSSIHGLELGCLRLCWERHHQAIQTLRGLRFDVHVG
jgi:hypothetical protein